MSDLFHYVKSHCYNLLITNGQRFLFPGRISVKIASLSNEDDDDETVCSREVSRLQPETLDQVCVNRECLVLYTEHCKLQTSVTCSSNLTVPLNLFQLITLISHTSY